MGEFYRKWWFWVVIYLILTFIFGYIFTQPSFGELIPTLLMTLLLIPMGLLIIFPEKINEIILDFYWVLVVVYYAFTIFAIVKIKISKKWKVWTLILILLWILAFVGCGVADKSFPFI